MRCTRKSNLPASLLALTLALTPSACQTEPARQISSGLRLTPAFEEVRPSQIAIVGIEDGTPERSFLPLVDTLRVAVERELAERGYAPLAPAYIDAKLRAIGKLGTGSPLDADWLGGLRNAFQEDAVLGIRVVEWDPRRVVETRRVEFAVDVLMLATESGQTLWSGRLEGNVKAGGEGASPLTRTQQIDSAAQVLADALVDELPIRSPGG